MVFTARHLQKVLIAVQRCHLSRIDALHLVIGVAKLALGGQTPGRREVLLLLLLRGNVLQMVLGCGCRSPLHILLGHLILLLLLEHLCCLIGRFESMAAMKEVSDSFYQLSGTTDSLL